MMGHSEESLLIDGRAVSGLKQGITTDIFRGVHGTAVAGDGTTGGSARATEVRRDLVDPRGNTWITSSARHHSQRGELRRGGRGAGLRSR